MYFEKDKELDTKSIVDEIEKAVYAEVKVLGFKKHGRTLHRFVDGDISQVINFQTGCPPKGIYDVLWLAVRESNAQALRRKISASFAVLCLAKYALGCGKGQQNPL